MTKHRGTTIGLAGAAIALWAAGMVIYSRSDRDQAAPALIMVDAFSDDLATLGLDLMVAEAEWARHAPNPLLLLGSGAIVSQRATFRT